MAKIGIVYSEATGAIRRMIVPDRDTLLNRQSWVSKGEAMISIDKGNMTTAVEFTEAAEAIIEKLIGKKPRKVRMAVVSPDNRVEAIINAEPELDTLPGKTLIEAYSKEIHVGDAFNRGTGLFVKPARVIEAHKDREGKDIPRKILPARPIAK